MRRRDHIRGRLRLLNFMGLEPDVNVLESINRSKDLFANFPREYDGRRLPPHTHRGHEHGIFTNRKWRVKYGFPYRLVSVLHNMQDRIHSRQLTFVRERIKTWYPGKLIHQMFYEPVLEDNVVIRCKPVKRWRV